MDNINYTNENNNSYNNSYQENDNKVYNDNINISGDFENLKIQDNIDCLNESRKIEILNNLDEEIKEMRSKYFLKLPNDVKPISRIDSTNNSKFIDETYQYNNRIENNTNLNKENELLEDNICVNVEDNQNESRKNSIANNKYCMYNYNTANYLDRVTNIVDYNKKKEQDNYDNKNIENNNYNYNLYTSFGVKETNKNNKDYNSNLDYINIRKDENQFSKPDKNTNMIDNINYNNNNVLINNKKDDAEEEPRDLDHEISISMNQSIRDVNNDNNYNYNFDVNMFNNIHNNNDYNYSTSVNNKLSKVTTPYLSKLSKESNIKYKSKSKDKLNKLKFDKENKFNSEHTFQPNINYNFNKTIVTRNYGSKDDMFNRLAVPKVLKTNERLKEKEKAEKSKLSVECTFKPLISKTSRYIANKKEEENYNNKLYNANLIVDNDLDYSEDNTDNIILNETDINNKKHKNLLDTNNFSGKANERLYKLSEQLREKRERLKREYEENIENQFSFTPTVYENSKQLMKKYKDQEPIYKRYNEVALHKKQHLDKLKIETENEERKRCNNFNPIINENSKNIYNINKKKINLKKRLDVSADVINNKDHYSSQIINNANFDCNERLYQDAYRRAVTRQKEKQALKENENHTFKPILINNCLNTNNTGNINDFLNRQKLYEELKKEKKEINKSKLAFDNNNNNSKSFILNNSNISNYKEFHPKINTTSDVLMRADHSRAQETFDDKIYRLYKTNFEKIQKRKENLKEFYENQNTYKPKINEISKFIGRDNTINDLSKIKESDKVKKLKEIDSKTDNSDYTYKPKLNLNKDNYNYKHVYSNYKFDDNTYYRIEEEMKAKQLKIEEMKKTINESCLKDNTFKPVLNNKSPNFEFDEPLILKGFARYVDQMDKARQAKLEKEDREKKVFINGDNWSRDNLVTIPKPFNLSYMNSDLKKKKDNNANKSDANKECTFKPKTNESHNKEIIKMILKG